MSRNFHNVHVHASSQKKRDQVVKAIVAYAKRAGFKRVERTRDADRVIRLGGKAPWFSVEDDAYGASELARAIAKATKLPVLEAYCEASARVELTLFAGGKRAGEWGHQGSGAKRPSAKAVEPLLVKGTAKELATAWDDAIKQVFPESALVAAGKRFGIRTPQLFGETNLRGVTIALARTKATGQPELKTGKPAFYVGWGSNSGYGDRHMIFEGSTDPCHRVMVASSGGPGRGIAITFSGSAVENGFIEILSVGQERLQLVRDAGALTWRDTQVEVLADFVEQPETWNKGRREADRIEAAKAQRQWYVDVSYRALKEGPCELVTDVATADGQGKGHGTLKLHVMWRPWRPSVAHEYASNDELFQMHRRERAIAYISLRGSLAEAWAWARPHIEAVSRAEEDPMLHVMRDFDVLLRERAGGDADPGDAVAASAAALDKVAPLFAGPATPFRAAGSSWMFGTHTYAPYTMDARDRLAVQLVLVSAAEDALARFEKICDDAIAQGAAHSALVIQHQYLPDTTTPFEKIALRHDEVVRLDAWHETHVRGVDKRIWLSSAHARQLDRTQLPDYATVTPVGAGVRIQVPDTRMRAELEPLIAALGPLVPSEAEAERWTAARSSSS